MSVADRPAAGLYVAAWALSGLGLAGLVIGIASGPPARGFLIMGGLVGLILGLATAAGQQLVARRTRPAEEYHGPAPLILFFLQLVLVSSASVILFTLGVPLDTPVGFLLAATLLLSGYLLVVWLFVVRGGALTWRDMIRAEPLDASRAAFDIVMGGATMFGVNQNTTPKPTPYHLTDACKPKSVQAVNGNYFYTTYEHCIKEAK